MKKLRAHAKYFIRTTDEHKKDAVRRLKDTKVRFTNLYDKIYKLFKEYLQH